MALGLLWSARAEIWSVGNGQQSSVETPQSVTSPSPRGQRHLSFFFLSSGKNICYSSPLSRVFCLLLPVLCNCSVVTACLSRWVPFSSLGTTTSSSAVCLSVCPSLPAPLLLLDGYHRLFSRGASRFLSTCHRLRKEFG